jgi:outer membrane protein assembly factor BamB
VLVAVPQRGPAYIDFPAQSLAMLCRYPYASDIAVLRAEKVNKEKYAIVFRKVRDLKGKYPGERVTLIIQDKPANENYHSLDGKNHAQQRRQIMDWAEEGKTAVVLFAAEKQLLCLGTHWLSVTRAAGKPPADGPWVLPAGCDSRYLRLYCGDVEGLVAALTDLLTGKEVTVPRMVGTNEMLNDRTAPIRRRPADRADPFDLDAFERDGGRFRNIYFSPFQDQAPWSTHRGNPQRTGADGPGPKAAKVLWVYKSEEHFLATLVPGARDLYASSLGAFNCPRFHALALDPVGDRQVRWSKGAPLLRQPIAGAPALLGGPTEVLVFGDGFHTDEGASLRCLRAADGLPLWQLPVEGRLVHFEGTPTCAGRKLYAGGGHAGVLCLDPFRVTLEGKEQDLPQAERALEQRWKELLAQYEVEKKKDPQFALPPDEGMLPRPTPKRLWQQGQDRWHVDAPVAVVEDRVLAASAYLDDDKAGECALVCLKAGDGAVLWKTPLRLNPWAGPTVGPYVLVGCSNIRLDPKAAAGATGELVAVELDTGAVKWRKAVPGGVLSSVAVRAGLAIFTATDGKVRAWDAFTGEEKWDYDAKAPFFAGPAVTDEAVYAADLKGVVHALRLADGKMEWTLDLATDPATRAAGMVYGSPMVHGGRLYLATYNLGGTRGPAANVVVCIGDK